MKKYLIIFAIPVVLLLGITTVFAQTGTSIDQGTSTPAITIDYRYNALLEFFLQKTQEKDYATAYGLLGGNYPIRNTLEDFKRIINGAGLTSFASKKWISFDDKMKEIGVTTIKGEFIGSDASVYTVTFSVIVQGDSELRIGNILEDIRLQDLPKRFPATADLTALLTKDLGKITYFVSKNRVVSAKKYLSKAAQARVKTSDISKAFRAFKRSKANVSFPANAVLTIDSGFPTLDNNGQGLMVVRGSYQNKGGTVHFTLGYDFLDWTWELGIFSLSTKPLPAR